jgi:hypothetical protein
MIKEVEELKEFLDSANGNVTITVNGMVPHISGNMNDSGAILAAFSMLKMIEHTQGHDMKEVMEMLINLNDLLGYHIEGKVYGEDVKYGNN